MTMWIIGWLIIVGIRVEESKHSTGAFILIAAKMYFTWPYHAAEEWKEFRNQLREKK